MIQIYIGTADKAAHEESRLDVCLTTLLTALGDAQRVIELTPYCVHLGSSEDTKGKESEFRGPWRELRPLFLVAVAFLSLVNPTLITVNPLTEKNLVARALCCPDLSKTDPKKTSLVLAADRDPCKAESYTTRLSDMIAAFCLHCEGFEFEDAIKIAS